ncbi:MAG TPA: hypothetical protein VI076_00460 [Actinopolymorphaceae bacterium]
MRFVVLAALTTGLIFLAGGGSASTSVPDPVSARAFAESYVRTLDTNDPARLSALLAEPPSSTAVRSRLARFGGRELRVDRLTVTHEVGRFYRIEVSARESETDAPVELVEVLEWRRESWRLGPPPATTPAPTPTCACQSY